MHRAWKSGAQATAPTAPTAPSIGHATAGDPTTNTPPTKPGMWWFEMITEELLAIVTAAGLTPSHTNLNQVKDALDALYAPLAGNLTASSFTGANQSLGANGYQKLPGGLILQWGNTAVASMDAYTISFPIAFPTACQLAMGGWVGSDSVAGALGNATRTTTGISGNMNGSGAATVNWLALGY